MGTKEKQESGMEPGAIVYVRQMDGPAGNSRVIWGSRQIRDTLVFGQPSKGTFPVLASSMASLNGTLGTPKGRAEVWKCLDFTWPLEGRAPYSHPHTCKRLSLE